MVEGTGLTHGILGLLGWIPGPVGTIANLVDAGIYCFVDHDYGMAALSLASSVAMGAGSIAVGAGSVVKWAGSGAAKVSLGAAKAAKVARSAEYVRTAATFVTNAAIFAGGAISLEACRYDLYQKYKAGELGWNWENAAEVGAAVFSAAVCVASGKGMVGEAKTLGSMMKEDNVVGRLKESVGRFGNGSKQSLRSESGSKTTKVPGRVQSRINIANGRTRFTPLRESGEPVSAGFEHVLEQHFERPLANGCSIFR